MCIQTYIEGSVLGPNLLEDAAVCRVSREEKLALLREHREAAPQTLISIQQGPSRPVLGGSEYYLRGGSLLAHVCIGLPPIQFDYIIHAHTS